MLECHGPKLWQHHKPCGRELKLEGTLVVEVDVSLAPAWGA